MVAARAAAALVPVAHTAIEDKAAAGRAAVDAPAASLQCSDAIRGIFANHSADDLVLQAGCDPCSHYIVQCGRRFRGGDIVPPGPYEIAVRLIGGAPPIIIERHGKQWAELRVTNSEISLQPIGWGGSRFQLTYRNHKTSKWSGKLPGKGNREDERVSAGEVDQLVTSLQTAEG